MSLLRATSHSSDLYQALVQPPSKISDLRILHRVEERKAKKEKLLTLDRSLAEVDE
ncbi:hypothetical protein HC762_01530 [bacterium]|nr:hypothetical protein [bacterium]